MIEIMVCYGTSTKQLEISLCVEENTIVKTAIAQSGIAAQFPEIDLSVNVVGIFNKRVTLDTVVTPGDRVEIYRPLLQDPKVSRKLRTGVL